MTAAALPRLLAGPPHRGAVTLAEHLGLHGLPRLDDGAATGLADAAERARLRGRGGAAFPTARKLRVLAESRGRLRRRPLAVVANGSEAEPASEKDRVLLARSPHLVLDGLQLAALALGAERAYVTVGVRARTARAALDDALRERTAAGRDRVAVTVVAVPAGFVAGEERALVNFLNGGPPIPTLARPWERGVDGRPTLVQNVETLAHLALVAAHGPDWFCAVGDSDEPGSTLVTVLGAVPRPGVREVATGTGLAAIVHAAGGDLGAGRSTTDGIGGGDRRPADGSPRALLVGGYAGGWLSPGAAAGARLLRSDLVPLGATAGCGVVAALPDDACGVAETARLVRWLAGESAGQCGPCLHGLAALAGALETLCAPARPVRDPLPDLHRWCGEVTGRGACRHPDGVVRLLRSALRTFAADFDDHARHGACERCATPSRLPLPATGARTPATAAAWSAAA